MSLELMAVEAAAGSSKKAASDKQKKNDGQGIDLGIVKDFAKSRDSFLNKLNPFGKKKRKYQQREEEADKALKDPNFVKGSSFFGDRMKNQAYKARIQRAKEVAKSEAVGRGQNVLAGLDPVKKPIIAGVSNLMIYGAVLIVGIVAFKPSSKPKRRRR